ncbi:hypothetical protein ACEQ8H_002641 [Pleosporales sp. CAS-2024a]
MPSPMDVAGCIGADRVPRDVFRASHPAHAHESPPPCSPKSKSGSPPSTTAIKAESTSPLIQSSATAPMEVDVPMAMQWPEQSELSMGHASLSNMNYHMSDQLGTSAGDCYPYSQNDLAYNNNNNYSIPYPHQYATPNCLRVYQSLRYNGIPRNVDVSQSYPPAAYQLEPQKHYDSVSDHGLNDHLMQMDHDYEHRYATQISRNEHLRYSSPYSDLTRASTPSSDSPQDLTIDKEQPYAQLIYQALLHAKGHTMILRDIYDWFLKHTDKAATSETKGWQNSIRHNLSMNGAFEKVDQPCEDSRKGFMWRLTEQALREGVKSTTRYRSKQPTKRGHRTHLPQPQRQASGAKGGQAARRAANMKRTKRVQDYHHRSDPYTARSVPSAFDPMYTHATDQTYPSASSSPYYAASDLDLAYNHNPTSSPTGLELFAPAPPVTQHFGMSTGMGVSDAAYVLAQSPSESLFSDSPTPSAEEPRTPAGAWSDMEIGVAWDEGMGSMHEYVG